MLQLRPYQQEAVERVRQAYQTGSRSPLVVLPTGGGKTVIFSHIAATSSARGKRILILVHRIELLRQTAAALRRAGIIPGLVNPNYTPNYMAPVQVAMVQTMSRRTHFFQRKPFDLIITDEAHHIVSKTYRDILAAFPDAYQLGVTATPVRGDGLGLGIEAGGVFDTLVMGPTVAELIEGGYLVKPAIFAPKDRLDLSGVRTRMGDYDKHELEERVDKPQITGSAVEHYRRTLNGLPAVAFCISVKHAQHVAAEFQAAGYRAYAVDGNMDDEQRARILNGLANGSVQVVTSCDIISEGTDIPAIAGAILLRPTQSTGLYLQQCLDAKTEVLTQRGWLYHDEVDAGDMVAAFGIHSETIKWVPIQSKFSRPLADGEKMFGISSPHLDVRVTGGHTMIVRGRSSTSKYWQKQDADQVANRSGMFTIPVSAESYEKPAGLTDDEIRFIGWVLTDGTVNTKTRQAIISQSASKTAHCEAIRSVIRGCGFKFSEYRIKRAGPYAQHADNVMFCVSYGPPRGKDKHLRGYGEKLAVWLDKSIPECFDKLNDRQVGILLEAMNMGDGVNGRKTITWTPRTMTITCGDNKRMADRLQAILVCRGYRCNQSVLAYDGKRPWYYLHIKKIQYSTIAGIGVANGRVSGRKPYERSRFEQVDSTPGELVWCITNELGTLVTRRNGKVAIVGNCGRALRPMAGKERAVILDHVGNVLTHGLPDEDRAWSLDGEEKRKKKKKDKEEAAVRVQQCKSCYAIFEAGAPACTACGTPVPVPKGREVKQTDGELRELTQADRLKLRRTQNQEVGRAKTLEELERIAEARGYKKGWAKHVYEARTKRSEWTAGLDANAP